MSEMVDPDTPAHGPDGPVAVLERRMASLLGKQAAVFFPSGTMAQQVALRIHGDRRGRRAFAAHPQSHLEVWEHRGYSVVHGLRCHPTGDRHRLMTLADLTAIGEPLAAVVWELPQRDIGGLLPEWDDLVAQTEAMRERGAAIHLDGARLWEAQTYYARPFPGSSDGRRGGRGRGLRGRVGRRRCRRGHRRRRMCGWRCRTGLCRRSRGGGHQRVRILAGRRPPCTVARAQPGHSNQPPSTHVGQARRCPVREASPGG